MKYQELNTKYQLIFDYIDKRRIKDALDLLGVLCNSCRNRDLRSQLDIHTETYLNILKYSFELSEDPEKEKVYNRLIKSLIGLSDDVKEDIIVANNLLNYYKLKTPSDEFTGQVINRSLKFVERLQLEKEAETADSGSEKIKEIYDKQGYKDNMIGLFRIIWLADKLNDKEIQLLGEISKPDSIAWYHKCIIVSALTLSLMRHFDSKKIDLLFNFYESGEKQVWQRALIGLVLCLAFYNSRIKYYPEILQRLRAIQGIKSADKSIEMIIIQFIKARETEKITRKIQQEILPEMIRIKSKLEEKLDLDNLLSSASQEDKNPEWGTFFKESPDVYNKLEEFTNLQMEGADVFLGAFAMLKQFDFFNEISNWFLPFYKENKVISDTLKTASEGIDIRQFAEGIERSNFLCDSDKYSFCLNIKHMPAFQKSSVLELFNMELKAMNELALDDELINSEALTKVSITQYFHDLYRFYKLHPLKAEFDDIFKLQTPIYEMEFFKVWTDNINILRNIGEFFFEKNHYRDALVIFQQVVESEKKYELFEKMAYCCQQLGDFNKALDFYHKAELLDKNRLWLLNRIAWCCRKTGDFKKALEYYRDAEKIEPDDLQVQANLGHTHMEMENYKEALKYYFKVEYLQPENHKVYRPIAWCSFMLGKLDNARKYLEKAITFEGNKNDHLNLGHIYWCQGNKTRAVENYRTSLKMADSDFDWFSKVLADDSKYLAVHGIHSFDIPLMIDYIKLSPIP
jgi:tetratricopeptide (TPR) repeat protein